MRASLKRTYANITQVRSSFVILSHLLCSPFTFTLGQDTLDYSNHTFWPNLLYAVAFLHTVVQVEKSCIFAMSFV